MMWSHQHRQKVSPSRPAVSASGLMYKAGSKKQQITAAKDPKSVSGVTSGVSAMNVDESSPSTRYNLINLHFVKAITEAAYR